MLDNCLVVVHPQSMQHEITFNEFQIDTLLSRPAFKQKTWNYLQFCSHPFKNLKQNSTAAYTNIPNKVQLFCRYIKKKNLKYFLKYGIFELVTHIE